MSEGNVYQLIAAVSTEMAQKGIAKDGRNAQQGYAFRGIDSVYNALAPVLAKHKLVIVPRFLKREVVERPSKSGGALFNVTVEGEFDFISAIDGSKHTARTFGEAMDSADKASNKAMSAAYKYAAFQTFCIPTEGDNDADATTHEVAGGEHPDGPPWPETPRQPDTRGAADGVRVTNVKEIKGEKNGKPWVMWAVKFSDGREAATFSQTERDYAEIAQRKGTIHNPVITVNNGKHKLERLDREAYD